MVASQPTTLTLFLRAARITIKIHEVEVPKLSINLKMSINEQPATEEIKSVMTPATMTQWKFYVLVLVN